MCISSLCIEYELCLIPFIAISNKSRNCINFFEFDWTVGYSSIISSSIKSDTSSSETILDRVYSSGEDSRITSSTWCSNKQRVPRDIVPQIGISDIVHEIDLFSEES